MASFAEAIEIVFKHEGGYVSDPNDAGGETNLGISKHSYPGEDIKNMSRQRAMQLYKADFWDKVSGDKIKQQRIANKLLDMSVLMGVVSVVKCLQRALFSCNAFEKLSAIDGGIGERTLFAMNNISESVLLPAFKSECAGYFRCLDNSKYERGWLNRAYE